MGNYLMTKIGLTYCLLFTPYLLFGQEFKKIITPTDTFFVLNSIDTTSIPKSLPDGRWKVFYDADTSKIRYVFNLKNNALTGYFESFNRFGAWNACGTYENDSLWTFRKDQFPGIYSDFKTGEWRYQAAGFVKLGNYKIPFSETDSIYNTRWYYVHGPIMNERKYHKTRGLVKETWYHEDGSKSYLFEKKDNYSLSTYWTKDQHVSSLYLEQQLRFTLSFFRYE